MRYFVAACVLACCFLLPSVGCDNKGGKTVQPNTNAPPPPKDGPSGVGVGPGQPTSPPIMKKT